MAGGSALFPFFVSNFRNHQPTCGAIVGVVILLLHVWLAVFVVLPGALLNAEMGHQSRRDTMRRPVKPMGQRGAGTADRLGWNP